MGQQLDPLVENVEAHADQSPDDRPVDANILQIAPDRIFDTVGNRLRVPAAHGLGNEFDDQCCSGPAPGGS